MPAKMAVDGLMIAQVLAVIYGGMFDLANGRVDFGNGMVVFASYRIPTPAFTQESPRHAKIAERVKISRMWPGHLRLRCRRKQRDGDSKQRE